MNLFIEKRVKILFIKLKVDLVLFFAFGVTSDFEHISSAIITVDHHVKFEKWLVFGVGRLRCNGNLVLGAREVNFDLISKILWLKIFNVIKKLTKLVLLFK